MAVYTTIIIGHNNVIVNVMFNDLKFRDWSITVQLPLLCVPQENLSWYSVLNIYHKVTLLLSAD